MDKIKTNELVDYLLKTEGILNSISESKNNILDLYITIQSESYEVAPEDEDMFMEILKEELRGFLKGLKSITRLFDRVPFNYERKVTLNELVTIDDFAEQLELLNSYTEELGGEFIPEIEEDIYELVHDDADIIKIERAKAKKEFLDELVKQLIDFTSELEVLLELDDEDIESDEDEI